jgi:hypothetical protein
MTVMILHVVKENYVTGRSAGTRKPST